MSAWNFTVAEAGIVERLKDVTQQGPDRWAREVGTRADLASVSEEQQNAPALYVVYDGYVVLEADEFTCRLLHRWITVVAVKNAAAQREVDPLNSDAGVKMKSVLEALHGFRPPGCATQLVPVSPPRPYYTAGFAYFPLAFSVESGHSVPNPY